MKPIPSLLCATASWQATIPLLPVWLHLHAWSNLGGIRHLAAGPSSRVDAIYLYLGKRQFADPLPTGQARTKGLWQ